MKRILGLLVAGAAALAAAPATAQQWNVLSPDKQTAITLTLSPEGRLSWRAARRGVTVLDDSPLGIRRADQPFVTGLTFVSASPVKAIAEQYRMPHGKRRDHRVRGAEHTVVFANPAGARVELVLRAHDDGVAFRYRFPESDASPKTIVDEQSGVHVPRGSTGWLLPQSPPGRYTPAYEDYFSEVPAGTSAPTSSGWAFPALFKTPGGAWVLLTEAGLDGEYCGTRLAADARAGSTAFVFPRPRKAEAWAT